MPYSPMKKYASNGNKNKGTGSGIFLLFLLLLPSAAQDLSEAPDELSFICPQGPQKTLCSCTQNEVNCTEISLLTVPSGLGTGIQSLILRKNFITSIDSITSQLPQSLVYIDASFNSIKYVDWQIFATLTNLEELYLQMNLICLVNLSYFQGTKLRLLNLSGNHLVQITEKVLKLPLEKLYIENCGLSYFGLNASNSLCKLKILHVGGNSFSHWPVSVLSCMTKLEEIKMNNLGLTYLPRETFSHNALVQFIDLSDNLLTSLPATIFDGLDKLQVLNLAGNPWSCDCNLLWLKVFLESFLAIGRTIVKNDLTKCITETSSNTNTSLTTYPFSDCEDVPKHRRDKRALVSGISPLNSTLCTLWQALLLIPCGSSKAVSCIYTFSSHNYSFVQFLGEATGIVSKTKCRDMCQENNAYFFHDSSSTNCLCGDVVNIPGCTECSALTANSSSFCNKLYSNVGEAVSVVYDLTVIVSPTVPQVMSTVNFTLSGGASIYDTFFWNFGDSTTRLVLNGKTTSHTYIYPGQFDVTVSLTSSSIQKILRSQVVIRLTVVSTSDVGKLICPSAVVRASTMLNVTGIFTSAWNQKVQWSKKYQNPNGQGIITEYGKKCEPPWTEFRNRCIKIVTSASRMATAHLSCTAQEARLLRFYSAEEIAELKSSSPIFQSDASKRYYTGAEWVSSIKSYTWKNTSIKAYVFREILPNATKGRCVVLTSVGLQGVTCNEQLPFVCEKDPVTCTGSKQSVGQTCFVVVSKPATWDQAQNACQSTYTNGKLASIFYSSDNLYISGLLTSRAWIGLRAWTTPGYYNWQNGQAVNGYTSWASGSRVEPCVSINSSGLWQTEICNNQHSYICEYFIGDEVKIPWLVTGFVPVMNDVASPVASAKITAPQILTSSQVTLLLGSWFSTSGRILRWNIQVQSLPVDARLSLQIWRPFCGTGSLVWPGCGNNKSPLLTCSSTPVLCSAYDVCLDGQYLCMLTNTCLPITKPCTCVSIPSISSIDCQNLVIDSTISKLRLIYLTTIIVAARTTQIQFESMAEVMVQAGDIIGFQSENKDIGVCEEPSTSEWRHPVITASTDYWMDVGDVVDPKGYQLKKDIVCRINAVYTTMNVILSPLSLSYITNAGVYNFTLITNSLSTHTCSVTAMDDVRGLLWVYPEANAQVSSDQGFQILNVNVEAGLPYALTVKVLQGSDPTVTWVLNNGSGTDTFFSADCPALITSLPDMCSFHSSLLESPYSSLSQVFPSGSSFTKVVVNVTNDISWEALHINIYAYASITAVEFYHDDCVNHTDCDVIVETGKAQTFHMLVKAGDMTIAVFYEDGKVINPVPFDTSLLSRTFQNSAVYSLFVNVSNPLSWKTGNVTVRAQVRAKFNNMSFVKVVDKVATNTLGTVSAMVRAAIGAQIVVMWSFNEESFHYPMQVNTTIMSISYTYRFNTTGNVSLVLLLSDLFGDNISSSITIEVYKTINVPLVISTSSNYVATMQDFNITIRVENCSLSDMGDYGILTFTVDWNDSNQVMTWSSPILLQVLQHQYKTAGNFTILVTVLSPFNTSNIQTGTVTIEAQNVITGLSLSYDGPNHFSQNITFTATQKSGSNVRYSIDFGDNFTNTSFQTSPVFVFRYSVAGVYGAILTAKNAVSEKTFKLVLYAHDENLLQIIKINAKYYVALKKIVEISADVAAESPDQLFYDWNFGNGKILSGHPMIHAETTYDFIGIYIITLRVLKNISSFTSDNKVICVEQEIFNLSVVYQTPIALRQPGASVLAFFHASVTEGSNLTYTWAVDGSKDFPHQDKLNLTVTEAGIYNVTVKAENNLNNQVKTVQFTAIEVITGLQVHCQSCFLLVYARANGNTTLEASVLYGTIVNYTWTFVYSSASETGKLVQHNFTAPRNYTVILLAENDVSNESLTVSIIAQDEVTGVSIRTSPSIVQININVTFEVTFSSGTNVNIQWKCDSFNITGSHSASLVHTFKLAGNHQCSAIISNAVSSVTKSSQVVVLDQITFLAINQSLRVKPGSMNLFAAVGFEYNFTAHINTYFLVSFEWRAQNAVSSSTVARNATTLKYTFNSSGIYQISLKAQNDVSLKNTSIIIEAQEKISSVYIESNKTSPLQVFTGEAILFHVVVGTGSHMTYLWTLGGLTLPSKNDSVILPFKTAGNFTVQVTVINDLDTVRAIAQVSVYIRVSEVAIRIKQNLNLPFVIRGTTLDLYSLNVSGTALVFNWTITHVSSGRQFTSDLRNIFFSFNLTGTYQVLLKVQNALSSEEDHLTLVVQGAVTELKVTLQDSIVATGSSLTFMAEANLDATDIRYIWQIDGEIKLVSYFVKLFSKAGVYKVLITAANNVSSMTKENLVIRVLDSISNLQIKDCQLVRVAQVLTSLQATFDSGTNVTFTWKMEISNQSKTLTGQSVNLSFQNEGTYSIILTAHNDISTKTTSCQLQAQFLINHVTLTVSDPSPNYILQNQNVKFTATGKNFWSAIFVWKISNYSTIISQSNTYITSIPASGNYTLTLTVSNGVSQVQVVLNFTVKEFLCQLPDVFRVGAIRRMVQRSRPLKLEVAINANNCTDYITVHTWTVVRGSNCTKVEDSGQKVDIGDTVISSPSIIISPRVLDVGVYCVHFATGYQSTTVVQSIFYAVNVTASNLKAIIKGGNKRTVAIGAELHFDGTLSFDPDESSKSHLTYIWTCVKVLKENTVASCFTNSSSSSFYYHGFSAGQYTVLLQVETFGKAADTTEQIINVLNVSDFVPMASVVCESCLALGNFNVSYSQHVVLSAACDNCQCEPEFLWKIFEGQKEIFPGSSQTTTGLFREHLVLNKYGVLKDGFSYTFLVQVSCYNSKNTLGNASLTLLPNLPPSNGNCSFHPKEIFPLDQVTVNCSGWIDVDSRGTLISYKIFANSLDPLTGQNQTYMLYSGSDETQSVYVSSFTGNFVLLSVMVGDELGAFTLGGESEIRFKNFTLPGSMTKTDYLEEQTDSVFSDLVRQASPMNLLQYAIALGQQLNAESWKEQEARMSGKGTLQEQKRAAVRDVVTICLSTVVPIVTLEDVQQMALALRLLTDYFNEYLTEDSQHLLATTLQTMNRILRQKVMKGIFSEDVPLDDLLCVIRNLLFAANARIYSVTSIWESGRTITIDNFKTSFRDLRPEITVIVGGMVFTDINLNETHRKSVVSGTVPLLENILVSTLQTMSLGEASLVLDVGGIKIKATRSYVKDIELQYLSEKALISIPSTVLSGKKDNLQEVFQIMISHDRNPYTYGYSIAVWAQMPVHTISFYETNGSYIQVANLADNARVGLCMFSSLVNASTCKDLVNGSSNVEAAMNLSYKRVTLAPNRSKRWQVPGMRSDSVSGVGVHVQLRYSLLSMEVNRASTAITGITAYLGINFIPSSKHYSQLLTLTSDLMKKGVDKRNYTFFQNSLNPSDKVHIVVTNNDNRSEVELSVGVYYSSCEYFDTINQIWAHKGCQAQEESTTAITFCKCNHLTSFGGSGIVSITDIDFWDLDNLDLLTNPVVFITVVIIFVIYILATILCRYLDRMDLKRISKIPLCGQVGSFIYEITMITGCHYNAGTSANVGIKLYGSPTKGEARHLTKPAAFQRNCRDTFLVAYNTNLGEITKILVWHDNTGLSPSWFLSHILVKDLQTKSTFVFLVNSWLSLDNDDGVIQKTVKVSDEKKLKKFYSQFKYVFRGLLADVHTWMSVTNKPDHSRFTRVQRCTCCLTCVYLYMSINAMWYGFFKNRAEVNAPLAWNLFAWEEVVIFLVSTLMVVPFIFGLTLIFKKSRSKASVFQDAQRPGSAQTLEIDALCTTSADGSFYRTATPLGDWISTLDRESTTDSISQVPFGLKRTAPMHRSKRKGSNDSAISGKERPPISGTASQKNFWNKDSILKNWPNAVPHWPSKGKVQVEHGSPGTSGDNRGALPKQNSRPIRNFHGTKSLEDSDEDILQHFDEADVVIARDEERRKKKLALKARQASGGGLFDSDDEWANEGLDDVMAKGGAASFDLHKEAQLIPDLGRRLSHTNFTLPDSTRKPDSAGGSKKDRKSSLPQDGARTSIVSSSSKSKTILSGRLRSLSVVSQMSLQNNSGCILPFWCVYVAYTVCVILCLLSIILVLLYGYNFGADVAIKWVISSCITLFISILIIEPLKVLVLTVYKTAYSGGIGEENSDMIDIKPQVESNEQLKDVKFRPLGGFALLQAKEEGKKKQRLHIMMREVLVFTFMFGLFLAIVYTNYNSDSMYHTNNNIHSKFYSSFDKSGVSSHNLNITNLRSIPDFWQWTQTVLARSLHYRELFPTENFGYLMGPAWLRQIRGEKVTCPAALKTALISVPELVTRRCVDSGASDPDTSSYTVGWASGSENWTYFSSSQTNRFAKFGQSLMYHGGGYIQKLGSTYQHTVATLQQLEAGSWVDLQTRALFIEFALYTPSKDLTSCVTLVLEFPTTGGILASSTVWTERLLRFIPGHVDPIMVCQVLFFPFILYMTIMAGNALRSQKLIFFTQLWNWLDLLICILLWTNSGLYITCVVMATNEVRAYLADQTTPNQLEKAAMVHCVLRDVHACLTLLFILKIVRQVRFFHPLYKFYITLATASAPLLGILFIFIILLLTYAQFGFLLYGSAVYGYHSFQNCLMSLFGIMGGHTNFWPMLESRGLITHLFFISFGIFVYGLVIALSVAVLTWSFKWSRTQMTYRTSLEARDYEMIEFMIKRFKLLTGIRKQKPLFRHVKFEGLPSLPSRSTSSNISHRLCNIPVPTFSRSAPVDAVQEYLEHCMANLQPAWEQVVKTVQKIEDLDSQDEDRLQDLVNQIMKPFPADRQLKPPNSNPVSEKPALYHASTIPRLTLRDDVKDVTSHPSSSTVAPQTFSIFDKPLDTPNRRSPSSQKVRYDPRLNNDDLQPKKRIFQFSHQVKPTQSLSSSSEQRSNLAYGYSAGSGGRMAGSSINDKRSAFEHGISGFDDNPNKRKRVWRTFSQDTEV